MIDTFLMNDFYTVNELIVTDETKITASVTLNENHSIFKGHFEKMPVMPGVCQTQCVKEILQSHLHKNLMLTQGNNIKFMAMIVPTENPTFLVEINFKTEGEIYSIDAKLFTESLIFTKIKAVFKITE